MNDLRLDLGDQLFQTRQQPSLRLPIGQRVPVCLWIAVIADLRQAN
jgi:hypothetical protein